MTEIDTQFIRFVQRQGWLIDYADRDYVLGKCPRAGCSVKLRLTPGKSVPETCKGPAELTEVRIDSFADAAAELREVRERYCLRILDVEECAGLATDHLAKVEREGSDRIPNVDTFILWAAALGFQVVLRKTELPAVTVRRIAESRDKVQSRRQAFSYWRELRGARRRAKDAAKP